MSAYEPGECTGTLAAPTMGSHVLGRDDVMTGQCPVCQDWFPLRAGILIPSHEPSERRYGIRVQPA